MTVCLGDVQKLACLKKHSEKWKWVLIFEYHIKSSLASLKLIKIDNFYTGCPRKFERGLIIYIGHPVAQNIDTKIKFDMEFLCFVQKYWI